MLTPGLIRLPPLIPTPRAPPPAPRPIPPCDGGKEQVLRELCRVQKNQLDSVIQMLVAGKRGGPGEAQDHISHEADLGGLRKPWPRQLVPQAGV